MDAAKAEIKLEKSTFAIMVSKNTCIQFNHLKDRGIWVCDIFRDLMLSSLFLLKSKRHLMFIFQKSAHSFCFSLFHQAF